MPRVPAPPALDDSSSVGSAVSNYLRAELVLGQLTMALRSKLSPGVPVRSDRARGTRCRRSQALRQGQHSFMGSGDDSYENAMRRQYVHSTAVEARHAA